MDYDDAFLQHIFKQTLGDAWFWPSEDNLSAGACLRVDYGEWFYHKKGWVLTSAVSSRMSCWSSSPSNRRSRRSTPSLLSRSARPRCMQHWLMCKRNLCKNFQVLTMMQRSGRKSIYEDSNTRIQILDMMLLPPHAEKEQSAAFIVSRLEFPMTED